MDSVKCRFDSMSLDLYFYPHIFVMLLHQYASPSSTLFHGIGIGLDRFAPCADGTYIHAYSTYCTVRFGHRPRAARSSAAGDGVRSALSWVLPAAIPGDPADRPAPSVRSSPDPEAPPTSDAYCLQKPHRVTLTGGH